MEASGAMSCMASSKICRIERSKSSFSSSAGVANETWTVYPSPRSRLRATGDPDATTFPGAARMAI